MPNRFTRALIAVGAVAALAGGSAISPALAKHGADDPPSHDRLDDRGGKRSAPRHSTRAHRSRRGADDRPGHVRHGGDDGPNHT
jgi:hypothetical protein